MKIALVHSYYSSRQPSGENVVVDAQAAALREAGHDVRIVSARTDELEKARGYSVRAAVNVATGSGLSPLGELVEFAPDIVHVHNLFPNWGTRWLSQWRGPLVATVHNFRPVCAAGTLFRDGHFCADCPTSGSFAAVQHACYRGSRVATIPLAIHTRRGVHGNALLQRADRVVALSSRSRSLYESFGLDDDRISLIPNFVDDIGFTPETPLGSGWVYVGRLTEEKGIPGLLAHWPRGEKLTIYGDGPLRDLVLGNVGDSISYAGSVQRSEVPGILAGAEGLVFPSEWPEGGIPQSYVEGLAAGRLVVAKGGTSAGDDLALVHPELVFDQWDALAGALSFARGRRDDIATATRAHYDVRFQRATFLASMLALYSDLITEKGAGARG